MNLPDDYESDAPKKWVSRKEKPMSSEPRADIKFSLVPAQPMDRGIPDDEMMAICKSLHDARQAMKREDLSNLIQGFATVDDADKSHKPRPSLRLALLDQIERGNGPERFAYAKESKKPIRENKWIRGHWILHNWLSFQDTSVDQSQVEIGLCDMEDALAAAIIEARFDCGEYSRKTFRRFREKYQLRQVPNEFKFRGILKKTEGCSHWEMTMMGGKKA